MILVSKQTHRHQVNLGLTMNETTPYLPGLSPVVGKELLVRFDGGQLSSDGGVLLLREIENGLGLTGKSVTTIERIHRMVTIDPPLPKPFHEGSNWVKGDMVVAVSFDRLDFLRYGKDRSGKRIYRFEVLSDEDIRIARRPVTKSSGT